MLFGLFGGRGNRGKNSKANNKRAQKTKKRLARLAEMSDDPLFDLNDTTPGVAIKRRIRKPLRQSQRDRRRDKRVTTLREKCLSVRGPNGEQITMFNPKSHRCVSIVKRERKRRVVTDKQRSARRHSRIAMLEARCANDPTRIFNSSTHRCNKLKV